MEYTKHFVCFLDILGFKNAIMNSASEDGKNEIAFLLGYFEYFVKKFTEADADKTLEFKTSESSSYIDLNLKFKASFFSDSIIISFEVVEMRPDFMQLYYALNHLAELVFEITFHCGRFMRGGLAEDGCVEAYRRICAWGRGAEGRKL